jgi:transposase
LAPGQASALAGLAPVTRQSGQWQGKSFVQGGRKEVRGAVYIAACFAARKDPQFRAFADRLFAKGNPYKLVITAVARKLVEAANLVLKRGAEWEIRAA